MTYKVFNGDCVDVMRSMKENSVDAIVCDPPYGLEFMGKEWDHLGDVRQPSDATFHKSGAGPFDRTTVRYGVGASYGNDRFSKPGIGDRQIEWPSFSSTSMTGNPNPTCSKCGGRLRGAKKCSCSEPQWKPIGKRRNPENEGLPDNVTGGGMGRHLSAMQDWHYNWAVEALRVAKPGAHIVAFGGTRTFHRLTCALEDAGWEIRDCLSWLYGTGFPKSLDVSKAIDKSAGATRQVVGPSQVHSRGKVTSFPKRPTEKTVEESGRSTPQSADRAVITSPATPDAEKWFGWGTALKPAWEPIVLARKPLIGTVAANVLEHGVGALNVDGCRIPHVTVGDGNLAQNTHLRDSVRRAKGDSIFGTSEEETRYEIPSGRWPANLVLDEEAAELLDEQSGPCPGSHTLTYSREIPDGFFNAIKQPGERPGYNDGAGGPSRFFYTAKASRSERDAGLDGIITPKTNDWQRASSGMSQGKNPTTGERSGTTMEPRTNSHPTVKPISLMRWLCTLITPPGGVILDPFCGSGSTGCAAVQLGFKFLGIEKEAEYVKIAEARIKHWSSVSLDNENPVKSRSSVTIAEKEKPSKAHEFFEIEDDS